MRQKVIIASLQRRLHHPANLLLVAMVGGMICIFRLLANARPPSIVELALPFVLLLAHVAFSPIPWQWTANEEPRAGLLRGFIQALLFNTFWVGLLLIGMRWIAPFDAMRRPHPSPPRMEAGTNDSRPEMRMRPPFLPEAGFGLLNIAFALVFGWISAEKEATEARERKTADLLRRSQSKALQNQLEPHVLYNALSSLSELVYEDPLAAEEVITRLADLYRMLMSHGKAEMTPLSQERKLVEAYLAMEQMRLGERLRVCWDWPDWADEIPLPPLFLQPLVENAIKHGISPSDQGGELRISCSRNGNAIELKVENSGRELVGNLENGVGLGNLKARLALWKQSSGVFMLERQGEWTVATVRWITRETI
jgi:hypothetical protein